MGLFPSNVSCRHKNTHQMTSGDTYEGGRLFSSNACTLKDGHGLWVRPKNVQITQNAPKCPKTHNF